MKFDTKNRLRMQLAEQLSTERAETGADRLEAHVDAIAWETVPTHPGYWVSPRGTLLDYSGVAGDDPSPETIRFAGPWMEIGVGQSVHDRCADSIDHERTRGAELERRIIVAQQALEGAR